MTEMMEGIKEGRNTLLRLADTLRWHRLEDQLKKVAELARNFASHFNGGDWAYIASIWQMGQLGTGIGN